MDIEKISKIKSLPRVGDQPDLETQNCEFRAHPLADLPLTSKIFDLLQILQKSKRVIKGINETLKAISKDEVEIVIMASNASPLAILAPFSTLCEERSISYIYTVSAAALGRASGIKRPVVCCCIKKGEGINEQNQIDALKDKIDLLIYS